MLAWTLLCPPNALACSDCPVPAGLLNVEDPEAVQALVQRAAAEINACLQPGGDVRRARLLLRFCVALVATNVLHAASVLAALRSLVDTALAAAEASECCRFIAIQAARAAAMAAGGAAAAAACDWLGWAGQNLHACPPLLNQRASLFLSCSYSQAPPAMTAAPGSRMPITLCTWR